MKKNILKSVLLAITATAIALAPMAGLAQETKKEAPAAKKEAPADEKSGRAIPFREKIDALDKTAKTIKVGERVFQITSETKIAKGGKPATLDDAAVGDEVGGTYHKADDGKLNAASLRIGPKPEAAGEKAEKPAKEKKNMKE